MAFLYVRLCAVQLHFYCCAISTNLPLSLCCSCVGHFMCVQQCSSCVLENYFHFTSPLLLFPPFFVVGVCYYFDAHLLHSYTMIQKIMRIFSSSLSLSPWSAPPSLRTPLSVVFAAVFAVTYPSNFNCIFTWALFVQCIFLLFVCVYGLAVLLQFASFQLQN